MSTSLPSLPPLATAIANAEGYGVSGAIPTIANNPGNLEIGDVGNGVIQAAGGNQITSFPTVESGWNALVNQINKIYNGTSSVYTPDMTLQQFGTTYSGGNPKYGSTLASQLGVSPSTPLSALQNPTQSSASSSGTSPLDFISTLSSWFTKDQAPGLSFTRPIVLLLGVILFAAGLFSFRQTQAIIQTATKGAKRAGEIAEL